MGEEPQSRLSLATVILCVGLAGLLVAQIYTIASLRSAESRLAAVEADQSKVRDGIEGEIAKMREASPAVDAERQKALDTVRDEVDKARRQARGVAGRIKEETLKSVEDLASRVNVSESRLKQQQEAGARVATEITSLRQAASSAQSNLTDVSSEVKQVRTEVANTQRADGKANRYTLELQVDDRTIEKKERTANEPVQFYVGRNRQPHELVVNQVGKDQIVGYLATPKAPVSRP